MTMVDALTIASIILSVVSVVLAAFTIWLSAVFYNFANEAQERVRSTAVGIERAVATLDERVKGLHTDTFSLVKDMVTDMTGVVWSQQSAHRDDLYGSAQRRELEDQIAVLRRQLVDDISRAVAKGGIDTVVLERTLDEGLRRSADAGLTARHEVVRRVVRQQLLAANGRETEAAAVMTAVAQQFPFSVVVRVINDMREAGEIEWEGVDLRPSTMLRMVGARRSDC